MKRRILSILTMLILIASTAWASSETTNLGLTKPTKGDRNWGQTVNNNMDLLDAAYGNYKSTADDLPEVYIYSDTFNSTTGRTITLPNEVDAITEYSVTITPTTRAGAIGDIYVTKTTTNFVVKCSEANTTDTFAVVVYYTGDASQYGGSIYRRWYVSPDSSITDHGNASTTGSLAWVAAQISTSPAVIEAPGNKNYQIKQNLTLADNISYQPQPGAIIDTDFSIRDSNYEWYKNGATSEYYLQASGGGNPNINMPFVAIENNVRMVDGTANSLAAGEWDWNDVNSLGYTTVYVRLNDSTDPDTKSADYVEAGYILTLNCSFKGVSQIFAGNGNISGSPKINYIYPQWFGALADGSTDDTEAIQAALNMASNLDGKAASNIVLFPYGTYKITSTLIWYKGTCLEGIHNSFGSGSRWPEIAWFGSAGGNIIETDDGLGNRHIKHIRRLVIRNGSGHTDQANYGVYLKDRADLGTAFEDFQVIEVDVNGIYFLEGGINVSIRNVRFDACKSHAICWKISGNDSMSIDGFTVDNNRSGLAESGGAIHFDFSNAINNNYIHFTISNGKIEVNDELASDDGCFKFTILPTLSQKLQILGTFNNIWVTPAGGISNYTGILVTPQYDWLMLTIVNSQMTISGIPRYYNPNSTSNNHPFTVINPHGVSEPWASPANQRSMTHFMGDANFHIPYQYGERMTSIIYLDPGDSNWDSNAVTILPGQWFLDPSEKSLSVRHVDEATAAGTLGTLSGVTGSGSSGTTLLTVNDVSDLKLGLWITIDGSQETRILHINPTTKVVTVANSLGSNYTNAAISFTAPTTTSHQLLSTSAAAPTSGTYIQGDIVFSSGASAGGKVGWICTTAGSPGTWKAFGVIDP